MDTRNINELYTHIIHTYIHTYTHIQIFTDIYISIKRYDKTDLHHQAGQIELYESEMPERCIHGLREI